MDGYPRRHKAQTRVVFQACLLGVVETQEIFKTVVEKVGGGLLRQWEMWHLTEACGSTAITSGDTVLGRTGPGWPSAASKTLNNLLS